MAMLTEIYIEALLADKDAADQVWELWDSGDIDDFDAFWAWCFNSDGARIGDRAPPGQKGRLHHV